MSLVCGSDMLSGATVHDRMSQVEREYAVLNHQLRVLQMKSRELFDVSCKALVPSTTPTVSQTVQKVFNVP